MAAGDVRAGRSLPESQRLYIIQRIRETRAAGKWTYGTGPSRTLQLTDKAHALLTRLELEKRFGSEPMPSGVPCKLVPRKERR